MKLQQKLFGGDTV